MGRLDIAFKDFLKQKHVLASLAEVMIFQSKGIIRPENVTILTMLHLIKTVKIFKAA